ncbi:hypothetical protein [Candidatus Williamhamiltonella defendens]|uniref:hypothetical protein n=1 Tax=Candidatus Williamhamiltonella defendens TaxID=138072 RepID=UPI0013140406|nr:hypothetical protein [Candidatus Hamiltonella defensa]
MLSTLYLPHFLVRRKKTQNILTESVTPRVVVAPELGSLSNKTRLAQYRRKKAIKKANPEATFPLEIYE